MQIIKEKYANIGLIVKIINCGGLVIMPTETVYGAMVDATSEQAVKRLSDYKKRPLGKPYSIAVIDQNMAEKYAELNETARNLYSKFMPGPITVISKVKEDTLAPGVASELGTVGVRIPDYMLVTNIIKSLGKPITATSANASYQRRPYKVDDILDNISEKQKKLIDLIVDAGELVHNEPSTVIDTTLDDLVTLRQGDIVTSDLPAGRQGHLSVTSYSEENTQNIGKELWQKYEKYAGQRAIIFALEGEMGAGKTQLVKGLAKAMGITETVTSPTFNLHLQYRPPNPPPNLGGGHNSFLFNHFDAWRMANGEELENLGMKGLIDDKSVLAIEWADRVAEIIRKYNEEALVIWINITYGKSENERLISWASL